MFEIGFSELLLCFIVALVVLGPRKLPAVARALGRWTGRARSYVRNLSAELERETAGSGLKRDLDEAAQAFREGADSVRGDLHKLTDATTKGEPKP
ncbi:MAG: Sec-independent protein translocase protein TatB [Nevskiaceae bacterium]